MKKVTWFTLKSQKNCYRRVYATNQRNEMRSQWLRIQQMSCKAVRCISAATVSSYQDLSHFEYGVIVEHIRDGIYYHRVGNGIWIFTRHRVGRKKTLNECVYGRLTRILKRDRLATLSQIVRNFNARASKSVSAWNVFI